MVTPRTVPAQVWGNDKQTYLCRLLPKRAAYLPFHSTVDPQGHQWGLLTPIKTLMELEGILREAHPLGSLEDDL